MINNRIIQFLLEAKRATHAVKGPEKISDKPSFHDLEYARDEFKYNDNYLGGEKFAGEEVLWEYNKPIWSMNYVGRVIAEGFNLNFLKEALVNGTVDMPYRGPSYYENASYLYKCIVDGDLQWFNGYEEIFCKGIKVYECMFHGGSIK